MSAFQNLILGEALGEFHKRKVRDANGQMEDILVLLAAGGGGGGGLVTGATSPLSIDGSGVLTVNLSGIMQTSHEANKIGSAPVSSGAFDVTSRRLTLTHTSGVMTVLSIDGSGNLSLGGSGVVTIPMLGAQQYTTLAFKDGLGIIQSLVPSVNGSTTYAGSQLANLNDLAGY